MGFLSSFLTLIFFVSYSDSQPRLFIDPQPSRLYVGGENRGVKIESVRTYSGVPEEPGRRLQWTYKRKTHRIKSLDNLRNHVHIDDATMALKYVRLYTSFDTWYQWSSRTPIIEITNEKIANTIPTYGLREKPTYIMLSPPYKPEEDILVPGKVNIESGFLGILSLEAYKLGMFEAPVVKRDRNSFSVRRWVFCNTNERNPAKYIAECIVETVGTNGSYSRSIVNRIPVPKLPDTYWSIPMFE